MTLILFNLLLRGMTLASRFLLVFALAKFLDPAEVGLYGLMVAGVSYVLMVLGFDFYTYSTRELLASDRKEWSHMLRDQAVLFLITYALFLPLCLLIFSLGFLPWKLVFWFYPLLVLEHLCQEFNRLLVAISEPVWASIVLFLRSGAWGLCVALWIWIDTGARDLGWVFLVWIVFAACALLLAVSRLGQLQLTPLSRPVNWTWIRRGLSIAVPLLISSLATRGIFTFDRYLLESVGGLEALAAYVLFSGIAGAIVGFVDAGVATFLYPKLIDFAARDDHKNFHQTMQLLTLQTLTLTVGLTVLALAAVHPLVAWLGKPAYTEHLALVYWTTGATFTYIIGLVPHYGLYALRKDRIIIGSHILGLAIFLICTTLLSQSAGEIAVPAAMIFAFVAILGINWVAYRKFRPDQGPLLALRSQS
jgi:O-antigen/teichoic acid export membrane protein